MSILTQPDGLQRLGRKILNAILPGSCLLCGADSQGNLLCPPCADDLPALSTTCCPICADQTTHGERCGACLREAPHFERTIALYRYDFPADRIIHALKYGHQLAVAAWGARMLAEQIGTEPYDWVIPLPLHPERLRERGFNQSAEIAREFGNWAKIPVDRSNVLRTRATPPQAELPHKARHKNVRGAFECRADFSGQRLLLIDDVMTTGQRVRPRPQAAWRRRGGRCRHHPCAKALNPCSNSPLPPFESCRVFAVVLYQPEIPPNTGNIIRLCANTGAELHLVEPLGFDITDKGLRRAGLDYHEYARVVRHADWTACKAALSGRRLFAMTTKGTGSPFDAALQENDVFVFGRETSGLPPEVLAEFPPEQRLRLPMQAGQRSLNLSNAAAVTVFEAWRQAGFAGAS